MEFNWVDWAILGVVVYYFIQGWEAGLVVLAKSLVAFLGSLWVAIKYHAVVGNFLAVKFGIPSMWTTVLGYIVVAFIADALIQEALNILIQKLPKKLLASAVNQWLGSIVATANGLILVTFVLLLVSALPVRGTIKNDIKQSSLAKSLIVFADRYGGGVKSTLDEATKQALKFITVQPTSRERITLDVSPAKSELSIDTQSEERMLTLVNGERAKVGAPTLILDISIREVARAHCRDMFERKYFSHINPEGSDAGDRLEAGGLTFTIAGENLAYAPDVTTAHDGLMNSEGHRRNILDPEFRRIGIGVIDGGIYGKMFTQNFTD